MLHILSPRVVSRVTATLVAATLLMTSASEPAYADPLDRTADPLVIDVGYGFTAVIETDTNELSNIDSVRLTTPTPLVWDPNLTALNRFGFGVGWTFGTHFVDMFGGVKYYFPGLGKYFEADDTVPSGLSGYPFGDVRAEYAKPNSQVPPRGDIPARPYDYTLHHYDTNITEYFSPLGNLIAAINGTNGARTDYVWGESWRQPPYHLQRLVDEQGAETIVEPSPDGGMWDFTLPDGRVMRIERVGLQMIWYLRSTGERTVFSGPSDAASWFTEISAPHYQGADALEHLFRWDPARPGRVLEVFDRRFGGGWEVIYRSPWAPPVAPRQLP